MVAGIIALMGALMVGAYLWGVQVGYNIGLKREEHEQRIIEHTIGRPGDIP